MINDPHAEVGRFVLDVNDSVIWNRQELFEFLVKHQGKVVDLEISEGPCLRSIGLFDLLDPFSFKSITIRTFNIIQEPWKDYKIHGRTMSYQYFNVPPNLDYTPYHQWNGEHTFGAFYNRPTWSRIGLAAFLQKYHQIQTTLNFRFNPHDMDQRPMFELDRLFNIDAESVKNFTDVYHTFPQLLEEADGYTPGVTTTAHTDQLSQFYPNFLIDVVAETFISGRSFYPTEKTTRPMLMKKPFIIMGPKCFLIHLRQMGFKTFHDFWDEDYDGYSPDIRYLKILELINSISTKSKEELVELYNRMQPILDHNYNLLMTKTFTKDIVYVD